MKKAIVSIIILLWCYFSIGQVPESFNYQAIPRNSSGGSFPDQPMNIKITIVSGSPTGSSVYCETFSKTTTSLGILNLQIGQGAVVSGSFSAISWGTSAYYLKIEIDPTGGTNFVDMGTTQLISVPYSMHSKTSETSADAVKLTGDQSISGIKTFSGTIKANNNVISDVAIPINSNDAANKAYVDALNDKILQLQADFGAKDIDGNAYKAVKIGSQVWMTENLKTTKYNDGVNIQYIPEGSVSGGAYSWYNNDITYKNTYGALYNFEAVMTNKLCPAGWHVPSYGDINGDGEWRILSSYLINNGYSFEGMEGNISKSLAATSGWTESSILGSIGNDQPSNNRSGFTMLPSGIRRRMSREPYFVFSGAGSNTWLWSTSMGGGGPRAISMYYNSIETGISSNSMSEGGELNSVRCIKD